MEQIDNRQAALFPPLTPGRPREGGGGALGRCPVTGSSRRIFVTRDKDVRDVLLSPGDFSALGNFDLAYDLDRDNIPTDADPFVTNIDGGVHASIRRMLLTWLTPAAVNAREPFIRAIAADILDGLRPAEGPIEFISSFAAPLPGRVLLGMLGIQESNFARLVEWSEVINRTIPYAVGIIPEIPLMYELVSDFVAERRAAGADGDSVTDGLLRAERDGRPLTDADVVNHLLQLITAGMDTTTSLISNLVYELLVDRSRWERLRADRSLVPVAVDESLRHDAPLAWGLRTCLHGADVAGSAARRGDRLLVGLHTANRDEGRWGGDADEYSLDRGTSHKHLSFGAGIHRCLGAPLAQLEARVALDGLLDRFPQMRLCAGYAREPSSGPLVRRPSRLDVELAPAAESRG